MNPKAFGMIDLISCIITVLLLVFLFVYPSERVHTLERELIALSDLVIESAQNEDWHDAKARSLDIQRRFDEDITLLRFIFDHEDVDAALDAINSTVLMASREDGTDTVIEAANIKGIITYLAGIEVFDLGNLF